LHDAESPERAGTQPKEDATADGEWGEHPRVTSLRPSPGGFSQRRLLNVASLVVAGIVLLALATHWLPGVLPKQPNGQATRASQVFNAQLPPVRGTGWKPIGPNSARDIAFTSNGALGYICSMNPLNASVSLNVYDVRQNTWKDFPTPASGDNCQVFVSPDAGSYVVLSVDSCLTVGDCSISYSASRLYDSYDGGETWEELPLPAAMNVYGAAWSNAMRLNSTLLLAVRGNLAADSTTVPPNAPSHLLIRQQDRTFVEVDAQRLVGHSMQFGNISLMSSGTTLYASLDGMPCSSYCTIQVRSTDDGAHWTVFSANYKGSPITLQASQPYSHILIGSAFLPAPGILVPLQSVNDGDYWQELPVFPTNPATGGAVMFALPDNSVYAFCYGDANVVYALRPRATRWQSIAPLPTGTPLTVQYDASGQAVALWGRAITPTSALGLQYYPLTR
jgi:hypothetical protein